MSAVQLIPDRGWTDAWHDSADVYAAPDGSTPRTSWFSLLRAESYGRVVRQVETVFEELCAVSSQLGYHRLPNGAMPLLKRQDGPWSREVVLRVGRKHRSGVLLATVDLHLTNSLLGETRSRYWPRTQLGLPHVATRNLGEVVSPHHRLLVNLAQDSAPSELSRQLLDFGLTWFDACTHPAGWVAQELPKIPRNEIAHNEVPGDGLLTSPSPIDLVTRFELVLAHQGWGAAGLFFEQLQNAYPGILSGANQILFVPSQDRKRLHAAAQALRLI